MNPTYLVQRLDQKPATEKQRKISRVFGGSMLGLSNELWDLLQDHFDIHYMGAGEYEFGALTRVLHGLFEDRNDLLRFELTFQRNDVRLNYTHEHEHRMLRQKEIKEYKDRGEKPPRAKKFKDPNFTPRTVYVLCRKHQRAEVQEALRAMALDKIRTKNDHCFERALDPTNEWERKTIGWLEMSNGFFFFLDREAFEGTCSLFQEELQLAEGGTC